MRTLFDEDFETLSVPPFTSQLLKWVGNKQKFAHEILSYFPARYGTYFEPFLGSGGVLGTLYPHRAVASDIFLPLIEIWKTLHAAPDTLVEWYTSRWNQIAQSTKEEVYQRVKDSYNAQPNGADLLFLCRSCYGGVVRFRQADGFMSTPCGVHNPIPPDAFRRRVQEWYRRTLNTTFLHGDFEEILKQAQEGDIVYCDPPYSHSQTIL